MKREKRLYLLIKFNFLYWPIENVYGFSTGMVKLITNLFIYGAGLQGWGGFPGFT
jgi:hypothetical protein